MRKKTVLVALFCLLALAQNPAYTWEFSMKGENVVRYRYWSRAGDEDIFGRMNSGVNLGVNHLVTHPSPSRDNPPTSFRGVLAGENRFGSDMNYTDMRVTFIPKVTVNPAITLEGSLNLTSLGLHEGGRPIGNWGLPGEVNQLYVPISNRPAAIDVPNTMVTVQWWKIQLQFPIFTLTLGYRPSALGMGLWKNPCQRSSSSISMVVPYGPLTIGITPYLGRSATNWNQYPRDSGTAATYRKDDDRNYFGGVYGDIVYRNGPLVVDLSSTAYRDNSSQLVDMRNAATGVPATLTPVITPIPDRLVYELTLAVKYFNGRFFFNVEGDYYSHYRSGLGATELRGGTRYQLLDSDVKAWIYGIETGILVGPAKLSFSYARATGDDPNTRNDDEDVARGSTGLNNCAMRYWAFLMYHMYGTGTNWNASGDGQPTNVHHVGARLDYAVASNLNAFVTNSWAWRDQPNAFILGGNYSHTLARFTNDTMAQQQGIPGFGAPVPGLQAVPDHARDVGWEVDFGWNWKVLENLTWNSVLAFWQPGTWWSYAYPNTAEIYRRNGGTVPQAPLDQVGATSGVGRKIDPLIGFESSLIVDF
ncbi:hypothetical protein [Desulfomonile tiedjei]|uniref:Short chain amide porin n=1 Tax=Desulfomonile tiedjei (strain ATCC 49306 / DSM 6799 / DCB-1) TaxID=706587 RepID=I4CCC4_DESTA|nr:hypothetical protein [Desulfomonile tiedjei]AFM27215.1 hypothetical protein Desti_4589 [Desulfomonile tiedjei DSM 6799]